jgi:hypothetical protein
MAKKHGAEPQQIVDELVAIDVDDPGSSSVVNKERIG